MLTEPLAIYDGFTAVTRGMDSGRSPALIGPDQTAFLINATTRTGFTTNRPGWSRKTIVGDDFQTGRFQGMHTYYDPLNRPFLVAAIGGHIHRFDVVNGTSLDLSVSADPLDPLTFPSNAEKVWMAQAEQYLPMQDNASLPFVFDGSALRRANPVSFGGNDFPVGNIMEYNNGRLWTVLPDGRSFVGGDLAYSVTGTAADVLTSTQNIFLTAGAFVLPSNAGRITAMRSLAVQDSVVGQGPLVVFGEFGSALVNAPFNVDDWQNTDSPIQTIGLISPGPTSQDATINVNGDIWYRSPDGVRSFMVARRDHNTWVNTPLSHEINRVLERDDLHLLNDASAVDFDNRRLETVSPYRVADDGTPYGTAWRGLSVLDFTPIGSMFDRSQPCWDGIWTGLAIVHIDVLKVQNVDRCFVFTINADFEFELWELSRDALFDNLMDPITLSVETRALGFSDNSESLKELTRTETWIEELVGTCSYIIDYRPDAYGAWIRLDSGSRSAATGMCNVSCAVPVGPLAQYRPRMISSAPSADPECCVNKTFRQGYEFQFRLSFTGTASLRRFRAVAQTVQESVSGGCLGDDSAL